MTAALLCLYVPLLSSLLMVDLSRADCHLRGLPEDFWKREIEMQLEIYLKKAQFVSKGLTFIVEFLTTNPSSSVVVFCKSRQQSLHLAQQLEKKLNQMMLSVDGVNINGSLDKINKLWRIQLFCDDCHTRRGQFHILVTTHASTVGIDKHTVALQVRFKGVVILQHTFKNVEGDHGVINSRPPV